MAKRYAIWDRETEIYTPGRDPNLTGLTYSTPMGTARFTPEEWMMLHPAPPKAVIICDAGDYNGGYFGVLGDMVRMYESMGADFSEADTDEKKLEAIEAWEDAQRGDPEESSAEERIAAALELQNVMHLAEVSPVNTDDPDAED